MLALFSLAMLAGSVCLALGWLATAHVDYRCDADSPFAFLAPALIAMDRLLLGQIAILSALVRKLIYARELLVGLGGLHTEGEAGGGTPSLSPASGSLAWVRRGLGMLDTARRVQARMAGHVAREIAGEAIREQTRQGGSDTPTTPATPMASFLTVFAQRNAVARQTPTYSPAHTPALTAAPWEDEEEAQQEQAAPQQEQAAPQQEQAAQQQEQAAQQQEQAAQQQEQAAPQQEQAAQQQEQVTSAAASAAAWAEVHAEAEGMRRRARDAREESIRLGSLLAEMQGL